MKHEYTFEELAELRKIYDESGEAGLDITEMRALRKAGLLTNGLPSKPEAPSKRDLILAHCRKRIDQGQTFDGKETAEALGMSQKTVGNILGQLRKEGLLPAYDKRSPRKTTRKTTTTGKKKETMTTTSKITADNVTESKIAATDIITAKLPTAEMAPEKSASIHAPPSRTRWSTSTTPSALCRKPRSRPTTKSSTDSPRNSSTANSWT